MIPVRFDFSAFYCAARVLSEGRDPYRYGPLRHCEVQYFHIAYPNAAIPVPLPPYAIALLEPLSKLPMPEANLLWLIALFSAAVATAWAAVKLTGLPFYLVGACLASAMIAQALSSGAMGPLPVAFISLAAVALTRSRWTLASVLLGAACIQPHVAFPPILAAFVLVPNMRTRLFAVLTLLAALSTFVGAINLNAEYLTSVIPTHALSELDTPAQYSLSSILHRMGVADHVAVLLGSIQYAIFAIAGVWLAFRVRAVPGSVVLAPLACAVTGGPFVHLPELAGALPFAFMIASRSRSEIAWVAIGMLCIPWQWAFDDPLFSGSAVLAGIAVFAILAYRGTKHFLSALAGAITAFGILWLHVVFPVRLAEFKAPLIPPGALAEDAWKPLQAMLLPNALWVPEHAFTYIGLSLVFYLAIALTAAESRTRIPRITGIR